MTAGCRGVQHHMWKLLPHTVKPAAAADKLPVVEGKLQSSDVLSICSNTNS